MGEYVKQAVMWLWQEHCYASLGLFIGGLLGISVLVFGFWSTAFVVLCGLIGLWLGREIDAKADILHDLKEAVSVFLPERFHRVDAERGRRRFSSFDDYDYRD